MSACASSYISPRSFRTCPCDTPSSMVPFPHETQNAIVACWVLEGPEFGQLLEAIHTDSPNSLKYNNNVVKSLLHKWKTICRLQCFGTFLVGGYQWRSTSRFVYCIAHQTKHTTLEDMIAEVGWQSQSKGDKKASKLDTNRASRQSIVQCWRFYKVLRVR